MIHTKNLKKGLLIVFSSYLISMSFAQTASVNEKGELARQPNPQAFAFSIMGGSNPISNPWKHSVVNFHLSIFSGQVRGVQGLQLGAISNHVTSDFVGYDATGIYSRVNGSFAGFQAGALVSRVDGNFVGMQNGGIYNRAGSDFFGLQAAGIANEVMGDFTGLQVSGIHNESGNVKYIQVSGISNEARDVEGVQIAGISNNANHVRGVQLGLVNRSEKLDGIAIGLVNLSESGRIHLVSWGSSRGDYQVGIKFAPNDYWYTILTMGQQDNPTGQIVLTSFESHMGFHIPLLAKFYTEIDLGSGNTIPSKLIDWDSEESQQILEARIALGLRVTHRLSLVVGLSNKRTWDDLDSWSESNGEVKPFFGIQL